MWRNFVEQQTAVQALLGVETTFNWLDNLPDIGIALLFGMVGAGLLAAAPFLREKLLRLPVPSSHSEATDKAFGVVISFTGIVLAFLLVQANINFRNRETQVGTEAHNLSQLDRLIIRYGDSANEVTRAALHDYANSIVKDEWPSGRAVALAGQGFALALLVALVFIFDEPFKGHSSVSPEPIITVIAEMQARTS